MHNPHLAPSRVKHHTMRVPKPNKLSFDFLDACRQHLRQLFVGGSMTFVDESLHDVVMQKGVKP
ncbi:hypothetical protein [Trinickia mobilis]|uniref:hypothetical protein n=1 Tax=Trinickia mobilis TaxID=2816356 RepID=UPI001A8C79D2|nr:hypothetical protein [Trinickia mobilis]